MKEWPYDPEWNVLMLCWVWTCPCCYDLVTTATKTGMKRQQRKHARQHDQDR